MGSLLDSKCFLSGRQFFNAIASYFISESRSLWNADGALRRDLNRGLDDVLIPITRAGGDVARKRESRQRGHGDVVRAADAGLEHPPAPHRNIAHLTDIVHALGFRMTANAA